MAEETKGDEPTTQEPKTDDGEALRKALQQERDARKAAEKRASDAEGRVADFERQNLVSSVIASKGVPDEAADLIAGTTKEELEASADKLMALLKPKTSPVGGGRPKELLVPGASNEDDDPAGDAKKIADRILQ